MKESLNLEKQRFGIFFIWKYATGRERKKYESFIKNIRKVGFSACFGWHWGFIPNGKTETEICFIKPDTMGAWDFEEIKRRFCNPGFDMPENLWGVRELLGGACIIDSYTCEIVFEGV